MLRRPPRAVLSAAWALTALALAGRAAALVSVTDPDDGSVFPRLYRPTGQFDETALGGFEFLISSRTAQFRANDQYLVSGEATEETTAIGNDLGGVAELSAVPFEFSIRHQLVGGRHFRFRLTDGITSEEHVLCWGQGCPAGSLASELLAGVPPIQDYNGLQIQVRAQDVVGSSAEVEITGLAGLDVTGAPFFDELVTPDVPGTISPLDAGRRGQWLLGDDLDFVANEWELTGIVTLVRPDAADTDLTKVRLAVDLVRDPTLPYIPALEPARALLLVTGLLTLWTAGRRAGRADAWETSRSGT
jgi:hypothetical protein